MSQIDMPVFCDVSAEEQIEALRDYFKSKNAKLADNLNPVDIVENVNDLIKNLDRLYSSDIQDTDLEMVLNSLLSLIIISPNEKTTKLVTTFCESILKAQLPEKFGLVKLRILSNLFHGLTTNSKDRYTVYIHLAKTSLLVKNLQYLPTNLDVVKKYLQTWNSNTEEIQTLYRLLFEALSQMNDSQNALKIVIELLGTYNKDTASKSRDDAHKCIVYCINDSNIFVFDSLLLLEPIKYLEGELIHNLFTIFVSGKLHQYMEFYEAHKNFISQSENSKEIPFDLLQNELQIEPDEIESFLIDAIRTKCIRCKIDHLARTVTIMSVCYRTFTKQHWQMLKERLEKWKENLTLVNQNLTTLLSQPTLLHLQ